LCDCESEKGGGQMERGTERIEGQLMFYMMARSAEYNRFININIEATS